MRTRRLLAWGLGGSLATLVLLVVALLGTVWWSVRSESGSAWLTSLLPGVTIESPRGTLVGDFDAKRILVPLPGGGQVTLTGVAWRGLTLQRTASTLWLRVAIDSLEIARIDIALAPATDNQPLQPPSNIASPIELELRAVRVGEVHAAALGASPLRDLRAHVHIAARDGAEHRVDALSLVWDRLQASGDARIATAAPLTLNAALKLAQQGADTLPAWSASASLNGPLAAPMLKATLRADAAAGRPAQALDLQAALHPFAAWPLGELQASTQALDLAAFSSAAPTTALSGRAVATSTGLAQPATVSLSLNNALPGRWNEGRLPVHRISAELSGRPDQPNAVTLQQLAIELGTPQASAGRVTGQGRWASAAWALDLKLLDLLPARLDARAPSMRLSGPVTLAGAAAITLRADLSGRVDAVKPARAVQLKLDATLDTTPGKERVELRDLRASASEARAQLSGVVGRAALDAPWTARLDAALHDFDPSLWWPGRDDSPWRSKVNRLNATGQIDARLPAAATSQPAMAMLAALRGSAAIALTPSTLAGVPLTGSASLKSAGDARLDAAIDLLADGNRAHATGRMATTGNGAGDAWDLVIDGPALNKLAPVYRLFQPAAGDAALAGVLHASAHVAGRWPALSTQGDVDASALRVGTVGVAKAQGRWSAGTSADAPVDAQLTLSQVSMPAATGAPGPSLETATLQLKGTGRAHTLELRADSKARPPAWMDSMQGAAVPDGAHTLALLQVQGGLVDLPGATLAGWRGSIAQIDLHSAGATAGSNAPLLLTRNIAIEALWANGPLRVVAQPGRAEVLGGAVRWSRIAWAAAARDGGFAQIEADADIEPLRIAPLLARAQPEFGWGGDLMLKARLKLRSAPSFSADVVVERASGDLSVTEEQGTRPLGLTDLRLSLEADNGVWNFTLGTAGRALGVAAGAVVVRTSPEATWPPAASPIEGVLELQVADLGTWGTWVPPGWRLAGALRASAGINGRFGAPEYTGQVQGTRLGVRNFLQGVNVSDGDVAISLQGTTARIERFTAKAGSGSIKVEGNAELGAAPKATLQLSADKFQLLGRVDRKIVASGQGRLQLDAKSLAFDGQFGVDEGLIDFTRSDAPKLSDDVDVVRAKGVAAPADAASAPAVANPSREVALDLRVALGDKLRLRGRGIDTGLSGELRITSPGGRLAVNGSVRAVDGTYAAYGQKLTIDKGVVSFNGALENPRLDIEATRPNIDVRVGVAVSGNASNPRVRLFSEPELSEIDKLSWLVMGRASDGLGRTDTALLQRAALALLAGEGDSPSDQLTKAIGLDDIGVRQQTDGDVRETVISLGKQLSRRWYVGYERGLNTTTGNFQLIYRIAQRFTLRAQSGQDNSLDLIWTWRWK